MSVLRLTCLVVAFFFFRSIGFHAQENLSFHPPADWELGNSGQTTDLLLMEFVKRGERIERWTELLTVQQFRRARRSPPLREFYDMLKEKRDKACPGLTEWQILEQDERSLLYEWKTTAVCDGHPPQSELARLLFARNTGYRVAFTSRMSLSGENRATWLEWLKGLSIER